MRVKKQRNIKSWDQLNHLVIRGFCYIRPLYNEVPLYIHYGLKMKPWENPYYTERQKKLITSSERRSLKFTQSKLIIFGHR